MSIKLLPLTFPAAASLSDDLGREVTGVHPGKLSTEAFHVVEQALYKHDLLLFRNVDLTPEQQYVLVNAFDPKSAEYGHGINLSKQSMLSYLTKVPRVPQVQVIGHGKIRDHEGIAELDLKHGHHATFHKMRVPVEDEESLGVTRFLRWHMDAALYEHAPAKVTALYAIRVPTGPPQTVRYDDGSEDELSVPLGTTAFVSGKTMFDILPKASKNLAVRCRARYAPHAFEWMRTARAVPTGLGLETEGLEKPLEQLSKWEEGMVKIYPFLWKNPVTGSLHLEVHPCAIMEILVDPLPEGANREGALYPDGAHLTDLRTIRDLCYRMQRPGIAPGLIYAHPWAERDLVLFHNRGLMHSVVGVFKDDQIRLFHQCNTAASDDPVGPNEEDVIMWTR